MDGNLFYQGLDRATASATAIAHLETVRRHGGLGLVDWHSHTSVTSNRRFEVWGRTYEDLLEWAAGQPDLWIATLGEIAGWATVAVNFRLATRGIGGTGEILRGSGTRGGRASYAETEREHPLEPQPSQTSAAGRAGPPC